jgi:TonB-linked SusC/RagA family outer membrane protein
MTWLWENTLNFNRVFGKHFIDAIIGYTSQETTSEYLGITGNNIIRNSSDLWYLNRSTYIYDPVNGVNTLGSFNNANGIDPNLNYSMVSFLARVNYTYNNKYILTATFRRDGSSKFSQANRFGNFPSFAAGWNVSKEEFMKSVPVISNLKIRGSWGIIGNEKIPYDKQYSKTENLVSIFGKTPSANSSVSYALSGNPNLKWESTTQTDIGLEVGILNNKLTGEFDYYHRVTSDILVNLSTPDYLGNGPGAKVYFNAASVLNRGYELKIDWKDNIGEFTYNAAVLGTFVHDEVLKIGGSSGIDSVLLGGALANGLQVTQSRVGLPIGAFYGYKTNGVFQSKDELANYPHFSDAVPGDLRIVDTNNDGKISGNDRSYIGSPIPTFIFGFTFGCQYKGFDLSLDIQGQTGNKIFNAKEMVRPDEYNFEKHVSNAWTGPGTSNSEPRASFGGNNYLPSDKFVQDGSFLRLRNLNFGYSLPSSVTKRLSVQQLRIYVKGNNLYTLTKFTGYTPEIGSSDVLSNGIDYGSYPISAIYSVGINLTF